MHMLLESDKSFGNLNNKLRELEEYVLNKIENNIGEEYKKVLHFPIWFLIKEVFETSIENLDNLKTMSKSKHVNVKIEGRDGSVSILCKQNDRKIIKQFLLDDWSKDNDFRKNLKETKEMYEDLNREYTGFKDELNKLIKNKLETGHKLKGKCEGCTPFWKL